MHRKTLTDADIDVLVQTDAGRRTVAEGFHLIPVVWSTLLDLIMVQKTHSINATVTQQGVTYAVMATVPSSDGPVSLSVQSELQKEMTITMIDVDRDQQPDMLHIVKMVKGKPEVHDTPLERFSSDDASQFLLAWSLAWGTIAQEQRARVAQPTSP